MGKLVQNFCFKHMTEYVEIFARVIKSLKLR